MKVVMRNVHLLEDMMPAELNKWLSIYVAETIGKSMGNLIHQHQFSCSYPDFNVTCEPWTTREHPISLLKMTLLSKHCTIKKTTGKWCWCSKTTSRNIHKRRKHSLGKWCAWFREPQKFITRRFLWKWQKLLLERW